MLQKLASGQTAPKKEKEKSPRAQLAEELISFKTNSAALQPGEAAKQWLALADRVLASATDENTGPSVRQPVTVDRLLISALPRPESWSELRKAIEARPEAKGEKRGFDLGLRLLIHTLDNDQAARKKDLAAIEELARTAPRDAKYVFKSLFMELNRALLENSDDPEFVLKTLERELNSSDEDRWRDSIDVPNLVAIVGEAKAEAFLRKAIVHPKVRIQASAVTDTHKLAVKLAVELADQNQSAAVESREFARHDGPV